MTKKPPSPDTSAEWEKEFFEEFGKPEPYKPKDRRISQIKHIFDGDEVGEAIDDYEEEYAQANAVARADFYQRILSFISKTLAEQRARDLARVRERVEKTEVLTDCI